MPNQVYFSLSFICSFFTLSQYRSSGLIEEVVCDCSRGSVAMPELAVLVTSGLFLGVCCVISGFVTTVSQQWAAHTNTSGRPEYGSTGRPHTFDHTFFMQTWLFLGQLACLGVHRIILKRRGPGAENQEGQQAQGALGGARPRRQQVNRAHRVRGVEKNERSLQEEMNGAVGGPQVGHGSSEEAKGGPGAHQNVQARSVKPAGEQRVGAPRVQRGRGGAVQVPDIEVDEPEEVRVRRRRNEELIREAGPGRRGHGIARKLKPKDKKEYNKIIFLPCALCDFAKTGLLFIGVRQTYPSSFIMLQGVGLLSTCMLTIAFVGREKTVKKLQWVGASICAVGLAVTGIKDYVWGEDHTYDPYGIAAGDLLIVMAQLMTSIQVILEQRFVKKHDIDPLVAVGLEGMFGSVLLLILLIPFYFVDVGAFNTLPKHRLEDPYDAFLQMQSKPILTLAFLGSVLFFPAFYYCGIAITKNLDAVHRMGVQININIIAWLIYLMIGWEETHLIQILGFALSFTGVFVFFLNPIIERYTVWRERRREGTLGNDEEREHLNPANPGIQDYGAPGAEPPMRNRPL